MVLMSSMIQELTGVKLYSPNFFPLLQITPFILPTMSMAPEKNVQGYVVTFGAIGQIIMIVKLIEHVIVVIPTGSIIMLKGSRPFYWILFKEANLSFMD